VADAGVLAPEIDVDLLFRALDRSFGATMLDWVTGELTDAQLRPAMDYGYALILRGAASPDWRGPLEARIRESQAQIQQGANDR
jgi:hypothetical protein